MGAWGTAPWDNDGAADWFGDLMEESGLPGMVEAALAQDTEDCHEEIRAAAYVLLSLGRVYVWPVDKLDEHLKLAIRKLREMASMEIYAGTEFVPVIKNEIAELESRLPKSRRRSGGKEAQ